MDTKLVTLHVLQSFHCFWFQKLSQLGPSYGYYPEPKKTVAVVDENYVDAANACIHDLGINVVRGCRFL